MSEEIKEMPKAQEERLEKKLENLIDRSKKLVRLAKIEAEKTEGTWRMKSFPNYNSGRKGTGSLKILGSEFKNCIKGIRANARRLGFSREEINLTIQSLMPS